MEIQYPMDDKDNMTDKNSINDSEEMPQIANIYGTLSIWISIISIILMCSILSLNSSLFTVGLFGIGISSILSIIGLFQYNKRPAIAGAIINLVVIIIIVFLFTVFIPMIVPYS